VTGPTVRTEAQVDDPVQGNVQEALRQLTAGFPRVETMSGAEARAAVAGRRAPTANIEDVRTTLDVSLPGPDGDIPARIYHPHGDPARRRPGIVFCHGGGFVFCDIDSHDAFCRALARGSDAVVVSIGYRLAPEHPAPAAALDAYAAFRWVVEHAADLGIDPARTAVAGDSAGGNLAAVTAIMCRKRKVTGPAAQLLLYPVIDPTFDTDSYQRYATGYLNTRAAMRWYWRQYLGGERLPEPPYLVAPSRADTHAGLPPAVIVTAGLDPLHTEGCDYARRLGEAGVGVVHRDFPGLFHGFATMQALPVAASALSLVCRDLRRLLAPARSAPR
jgi:acetyl esterase/lipase